MHCLGKGSGFICNQDHVIVELKNDRVPTGAAVSQLVSQAVINADQKTNALLIVSRPMEDGQKIQR